MSREIIGGPCPNIPKDMSIPQFMYATKPKASTPFVIDNETGKKFGLDELHARSRTLVNALYQLGVGRKQDDVVCILSPNHINYPVVIWAVQLLNGIITPANPAYTVQELVHQLKTSKAETIVVHSSFLDLAIQAASQVGIPKNNIVLIDEVTSNAHKTVSSLINSATQTSQEFTPRGTISAKTKLAFLLFSSGTTGQPKAVAISHYAVIANIIQMWAHFSGSGKNPMEPGSTATAVLPFFHVYSLVVNMHFMLFCGISIVVIPKFSFEPFLLSIIRYKITHLFVVPPMVVLLCKSSDIMTKYDFSHVKYLMSGAAPLSGDLVDRLCTLIPNASIGQGYGLTETSTSVAMFSPSQRIGTTGSAGRLLPGIVARVVKPDGSLANRGEPGELVVTGPSMALGYYGDEKATRETFVDGWVKTGDEVIIDESGDLFIVDRIKEIMKVRGFQVAPAELEGHLLSLPVVADACVVDVFDEFSGSRPFAYVVLHPGTKPTEALKAELMKHVADHKVAYKHLVGIEYIDSIPKNPAGKMLRKVLRARQAEKSQLKSKL